MLQPSTDEGQADLRRRSVTVDLEARFMRADRREYLARIVEMSPAEMVLHTANAPKPGETIIVYASTIGRFEGKAGAVAGEGFRLTLALTALKRSKLADQLDWFASKNSNPLPESRRHERIVPLMQRTIVRLRNGKEHIGKILDLSVTGARIEANAKPLLGAEVQIGSRAARVLRLFEGGFVGEFLEPLEERDLGEARL